MATQKIDLLLSGRLNVSDNISKLVEYDGNNYQYYNYSAPTPGNNGYEQQILFENVTVAGSLTSTLVSRNLRCRYKVSIAVDETQAQFAVLPQFPSTSSTVSGVAPNCSLRSFPLSSITNTLQLTINGGTNVISLRQTLPALQRTIPKHYLQAQATEAPCMPDNRAVLLSDSVVGNANVTFAGAYAVSTVYPVTIGNLKVGTLTTTATAFAANQILPIANLAGVQIGFCVFGAAAPGAGAIIPVSLLSNKNESNQPLSTYENSDGATRGGFLPISVTLVGTVRTYVFQVVEPVFASPCILHENDTFLGLLNTLSLQYNFANTTDMLCFANNVNLSASIQSIKLTEAYLEVPYVSVDPQIVRIPDALTYSAEVVVPFNEQQSLTSQWNSQTYRLNSMPKLWMIGIREPISARTPISSDKFISWGNPGNDMNNQIVSITLGTRSGLLAGCSLEQLYRITKRNGYNGTFDDWVFGSGCVLILSPADLGYNPFEDVCPGESGSINFSININVVAQNYVYAGLASPVGSNCELSIICVYAAEMKIDKSTCFFNTGVITPQQVDAVLSKAPKDGTMMSSEQVNPTVGGDLKSMFAKGKHILSGVASAVKHPLAQAALGALHKFSKGGVMTGGIVTAA